MLGGNTDQTITRLPPFCDARVVFATVVVAELLVCIVALSSAGQPLGTWRGFTLASLYVQWVALTAISLLCVLRARLAPLGITGALIAAWFLVMGVTLLGALAAWWLNHRFNLALIVSGRPLLHFLMVNLGLCGLVSAAALRYLHIQSDWERRVKAQAQARVQALQARIRPHFLFNSMNTIASLIRRKPELAESAVEDLSDLFRYALEQRSDTTLATELELTRRYLALEALRLGDRLTIKWQLNQVPEDARVPPLTLQPLVENAVYHGIQPVVEGGTVEVAGTLEGSMIELSVTNPVPEMGADARHEGNRIAQSNIAERMKLFFGGRGELRVDQAAGYYQVVLRFPYQTRSEGRDASADR